MDWPLDPAVDALVQRRFEAFPDRPIAAPLALAAALYPASPKDARTICRALRLSNRQTDAVAWLIRSLPRVYDEASLELADLKILMAEAYWPDLLQLLRVDLLASDSSLDICERVQRRAVAIPEKAVAPTPLLTGDDLTAMGLPPGPRFGQILETVYRSQLNEAIATHEEAAETARSLMAASNNA